MTTLLAFVFAIAVLVVFHELGHYWVARLCDVKVLRFSIGFGRKLAGRHFGRGETEWVISAIPLGGYVKMLDEREGEVAEHELHRAFNRKPVWQRMLIVVIGPLANLLLAVLLYWVLFMHGVPGLKPELGMAGPQTPAAAAGFREHETVLGINGAPVSTWQDVRMKLLSLALQGDEVRIEGRSAQGEILQHQLDLKLLTPNDLEGDFLPKLGLQLYRPVVLPVIGKLVENSVAQRAGLQAGDRILRANGHDITRWEELVEVVRSHPGSSLRLDVERGGHQLTLDITPDTVEEAGETIGKIGAAPRLDRQAFEKLLTRVKYPPLTAFGQALRKSWETAALSMEMLGKMVLGELSLKNLGGPITIADYAGQSAQQGATAYLEFLALISISLGMLNLLPIPLLDGGHLLYYTVELIKGSPVSEKAWETGQNVGIVLLATLMIFALYNDINRLISG
jgi:regulator of sigma E protease